MNRKLLYIVNPISGKRDKKIINDLIQHKTTKAGFAFSIYPSVASGDYAYLIPIIKEQGFTDIIVAGGDGTVNHVVKGLKNLRLPFGILPFGSGNGLAFSAGMPRNPGKAMDALFNGKPQWVDAFMINETFACMLCGLGFDAQVAHDFAAHPRRGLSTYVKKTISHFITAKTFGFSLKSNNKIITTDAFFISIANSNQFGNQVTIAPAARLNDGLLDIVVMTKQNKFSVLLEALNQIGGYHPLRKFEAIHGNENIIYFQTGELIISNPHDAPLHIDGDPVETMRHLNIRIQKNCFRLIYPSYSIAQ